MFLYFLHIPKTAGTSARLGLERMLAQSGGHLKHLPLLDDLLRPENSEWTSLDYLTGHLGVVPIVHASPQHVVTLLREPVAHLFSWYWHIRRVPDHHYHQIVTDEAITFDSWLEDPRFAHLTDNPQARYLGVVPPFPSRAPSSTLPSRLQAEFEALDRGTDGDLLSAALTTLGSCSIVGTTSEVSAFMSSAAKLLGTPKPANLHVNANDAIASRPSRRQRSIALARAPIDVELFGRATELTRL